MRVTVDQLNVGGEAEIRIEAILAEADCSPSSLYHHFGNLRGLLDEAQIARFSAVLKSRTEDFITGIQEIKTREELIRYCVAAIDGLMSGDGPIARSQRVNALGSTYMRPEFAKQMAEAHVESCVGIAAALRVPQLRGLLDESLDLLAIAHWVQGLFFSRVLVELTNDETLGERWNLLTRNAILFTLFGSDFAADGL